MTIPPIPRGPLLLAAFATALARHGLAPEGLDPWRGWVAFKAFVRAEARPVDPGVSVQLGVESSSRRVRLCFTRQESAATDDAANPIGAVVCEFSFVPGVRPPSQMELWSFDFGSFDRFVDAVEATPVIADLMVTRPLRSDVYWEDAPPPSRPTAEGCG